METRDFASCYVLIYPPVFLLSQQPPPSIGFIDTDPSGWMRGIYKQTKIMYTHMTGAEGRSLLVMLCIVAVAGETDRMVVTFFRAGDAARSVSVVRGVSTVKQYGRRLVVQFPYAVTLELDGPNVTEAIESEMGQGVVERVELDYRVRVSQIDIDINETMQVSAIDYPELGVNSNLMSDLPQGRPMWNILAGEPYGVRAEPVWQFTNSTPEVVVAVVDSGLAEAGTDAFLHVGAGYDFISDPFLSLDEDGRDADPTDPGDYGPECPVSSWHGTRVASVLAARHDTLGMKGVAQNITLLPVRVLGECRTGYASDVADAIVWAAGGTINGVASVDRPAKIIAMAFSGQGQCPGYLQSAVNQAVGLGALLIVAAGNNGMTAGMYFPGNCGGTFVVAASTRQGDLATYSNGGAFVDLAAPGGDYTDAIMSLAVDETGEGLTVAFGVGTSFAVPHVAGVAALALARYKVNSQSLRSFLEFNNTECKRAFHGILTASKLLYWESNYLVAEKSRQDTANNTNASNSMVLGAAGCPSHIGTTWSTYLGQNAAGLGPNSLLCPAGCIVTGVDIYANTGGIDWIAVRCSNGGPAPLVGGYRGCLDCNGQSQYGSAYSPNGFNSLTAYAGGNLNGFLLRSVSGQVTQWGCICQNTYNMGCGGGGVISGFRYYVRDDGKTLNSVGIECTALGSCGANQYLLNGYCEDCAACSSGYKSTKCGETGPGECVLCPNGKHSPGGYTSDCADCPVGKSSREGSGCFNCRAGQSSAGGECFDCNPGQYSNEGQACQNCDLGRYSEGGAASCIACNLAGTCPLGEYRINCGGSSAGSCTSCYPCPAGTKINYCAGAVDYQGCSNCPLGTYSDLRSFECTNCPEGKYTERDGSASCTVCPNGKYSSGSGNYLCSSCPQTFYCVNGGNIKCTDPGTYCPPGTSAPIDCKNGFYCSTPGQASPTPCNAGYHCPNSGRLTSSTICPAGYYCPAGSVIPTVCPPGTYGLSQGLSSCTACPAGKYAVNNNQCMDCIAGKYSDIEGASTINNCIDCIAGTYSPTIGAGSIDSCKACATGTYSVTEGAPSISTCRSCPAGKFAGVQGALACSSCPDYQYSAAGASKCSDCPSDSYGINNQCTPCTSYTCNLRSKIVPCTSKKDAYCEDCIDLVALPNYAEFNNDNSCMWKCSLGYYQTGNSCAKCAVDASACNAGYYRTTCTSTADGVCTPCSPVTGGTLTGYGNTLDVATSCPFTCNAGYEKFQNICTQCLSGKYSDAGLDCQTCPSCPRGQYRSGCGAGQGGCSACLN